MKNMLQKIHTEIWPWYNPGSRLFFVNIIASALISLVFLIIYHRHSLMHIFNSKNLTKYWLNSSAILDYKIYLINGIIKVMLFAPVLGLSFYFSKYTIKFLFLIQPNLEPYSGGFISFLFATIFVYVWDDFLRFIHHYLMHTNAFLWQLHKTHHSAEVLTPFTLYRIHPLESLMAMVRNSLSFGVSGGILMFLFSGKVDFVTLFGINIFGSIFNLAYGNLRHSHIDISFGWFEHVLISPKQHQIHHSKNPDHFNKNFGVGLAFWDKLLGTLMVSKNQKIISFGVQGTNADSLAEQFWPWKNHKVPGSVCELN